MCVSNHGLDFIKKMCHRQDFIIKKDTLQAVLIRQNAKQARFSWSNPDGYSLLLMWYVIHFVQFTLQNLVSLISWPLVSLYYVCLPHCIANGLIRESGLVSSSSFASVSLFHTVVAGNIHFSSKNMIRVKTVHVSPRTLKKIADVNQQFFVLVTLRACLRDVFGLCFSVDRNQCFR